MRKSMTSKLLAENKWLKKQVNELKKDIHTLITKPDGYEALEIKAGRQMSQQAIDGIMAGSYGKGIKLKPLDKETLDQFVEDWKKVPIKHIKLNSSFLKRMDYDSTMTCFDDVTKVVCEKCHIKKGVDDAKKTLIESYSAPVLLYPNVVPQDVYEKAVKDNPDYNVIRGCGQILLFPKDDFVHVKSGECNIHVKKHPFWKGLFKFNKQ